MLGGGQCVRGGGCCGLEGYPTTRNRLVDRDRAVLVDLEEEEVEVVKRMRVGGKQGRLVIRVVCAMIQKEMLRWMDPA